MGFALEAVVLLILCAGLVLFVFSVVRHPWGPQTDYPVPTNGFAALSGLTPAEGGSGTPGQTDPRGV